MLRGIPLVSLRHAVVVAEVLNFHHAANVLGVTQSSVSARIKGLVAAGDGITLTCEATTHVSFPGVVFRSIADETEPARFSAVWSPHNRNPALMNLLDLAAFVRDQAGVDRSREARIVQLDREIVAAGFAGGLLPGRACRDLDGGRETGDDQPAPERPE